MVSLCLRGHVRFISKLLYPISSRTGCQSLPPLATLSDKESSVKIACSPDMKDESSGNIPSQAPKEASIIRQPFVSALHHLLRKRGSVAFDGLKPLRQPPSIRTPTAMLRPVSQLRRGVAQRLRSIQGPLQSRFRKESLVLQAHHRTDWVSPQDPMQLAHR